MAIRVRLVPIVALSSLVSYFVASLLTASPQNHPADAAEVSRDLLFLAPTRIEPRPSTPWSETLPQLQFLAERFEYIYAGTADARLQSGAKDFGAEWIIQPVKNTAAAALRKVSFTLAGEKYTLRGRSDDDHAVLDLFRGGSAEPFITAVVWNREQLAAPWLPVLRRRNKDLTAAALQKDLEVGDPILSAIEPAGDSLWVAVGHSSGEGELGLGTVVRFDIKAEIAAVFQPAELATCDVTQVSLSGPDALLLGTRRQYDNAIQPCAGLVRFHPSNRRLEKIAPASTPLENSIITALWKSWVATDKGICSGQSSDRWKCWRIVPTVTLKAGAQITNKPGEKSGSEVKPGEYEVLWANQAFLEIATKDSYDAWLAADDFAEAAARNFDTEPYKLLNTSNGFSPIRPLVKPGGEALEGTLVYRAPLEKLPAPQGAPAGWVKVRIHAGWIARGDLEVIPKLIPVSAQP
jgi:hypothetical protein